LLPTTEVEILENKKNPLDGSELSGYRFTLIKPAKKT